MKAKLSTTFRIALLLAVFGLPTVVWAQVSTTTNAGDMSVDVQTIPISLTQVQALYFGTIMPFGRPGYVLINSVTGDTTYENINLVSAGTRADWIVNGIPNAMVALVHDSEATVTNGAGDTMSVTDFTAGSTWLGTNPLDAGGQRAFSIGAVLQVGANQPPGAYAGTYNITAFYN